MTTTVKKGTGRPAAEARKAKAAQRSSLPKKAGKPIPRPESHPERRDGSGPAKLARMKAALEPFGWKVSAKTGPGNRIEATARRGKETLRMVWVDGAYDYGASRYLNGDVNRKVRNLSEAIRMLGSKIN
jgi:hypothetical protein